MKDKIFLMLAAAGAGVLNYIGSWSSHILTLSILMAVDFAIGLAMPVFAGKSKKSAAGKIESRYCRRGLIKKGVMLLVVYVSYLLGNAADVRFLADAVTVAFILNEAVSILEHAAVMGVPIPAVLSRALNAIHDKTGAGLDALAGSREEGADGERG
jgi:toxin secretion/phage lysis holin